MLSLIPIFYRKKNMLRIRNRVKKLKEQKLGLDIRLVPNIFISSVVEPQKFNLDQFVFDSGAQFDPSSFIVCGQLEKLCPNMSYFPTTQTLAVTHPDFCNLIEKTKSL